MAANLPAVVSLRAASGSRHRLRSEKTPGNGLIQIETDPIKLSTVAQFTATPAERHTPRRRRERQREVYVENEPLVQIETQHPPGIIWQ